MEKTGILISKKYRSLLISTLAMSASTYISSILDGIMVGRILGTEQLSAISLTTSVVFLISIPISLFTFGGNTLAVMYKGRRDSKTADRVFTLSFMAAMLFSAVMTVTGIALIEPVSQVLTEAEAVDIFKVTFRIVSINVLLIGIIYVMRSFFQATGQKMIANILVVVDGFLSVVPLMYALSKINIYWLWASFPFSKLITLAVMFICMAAAKKKQHRQSLLLLGDEEGKVLSFSVKNDVSEASAAARRSIEFCRENGVDPRIANAVGVTAEELCRNISEYSGTPQNPSIDILIRILSDSVTICLRDNGPAFDPTQYIDNSGREITGLELVRSLSSGIDHSRVLEMNLTSVTVSRQPAAS